METEDFDFVAEEHDRLVKAISKLDKTQHITEPTRNEPTNLNSEFNLIKPSKKLKLDNVVKVLEDTSHNVKISKKLKLSQKKGKVLSKPLEKPQAERIKRAAGYEETKKKVGRWDPVVARNRTVDFVSFPLKSRAETKDKPTNVFLSKLKLKSPLELELEKVDPTPEIEPEIEEEQLYPMSYEEMIEHRQHLAKFRAQQSYRAAKAKRQSKIKSKKYHRILKKEKLKQQLKEFEELQATNPEEALKKLEELEKARALERHTLRHKNTGKWAKSKLVRAKYDKEVRQQLSEQLSVSRGLTQKTQDVQSSDDDPDESENICDMPLSQDSKNPWMLKSSDKSNVDAEFNFGYKKYLKDRMYKRAEQSDSEDEADVENNDDDINTLKVLREGLKKISDTDGTVVTEEEIHENVTSNDINSEEGKMSEPVQNKKGTQKQHGNKIVKRKIISTSDWNVEEITPKKAVTPEDIDSAFDNHENKVALKVAKKLKNLKHKIKDLENVPVNSNKNLSEAKNKEIDNLEYLKINNKKQRPVIDEPLLESNKRIGEIQDQTKSLLDTLKDTRPIITENGNTDIDPSKFIEVKPKYLKTAVSNSENNFDDLDDDTEQTPKVDIEEVFEEDDVVTNFRQEKEDEINENKPKLLNLKLPGWGDWAGKGVKVPKTRKRNRFIVNKPLKMARRDENKGDIIINESKNPKLATHKVSDLPFPFNSVKEYEECIRTPLGNTFIPETAHKKLIKPNVITRAGTIIEPMDEEELLVARNRNFKNESVIKVLGKQ